MRVLVTGASGHVGSVVIPALVADGHEVVGLARSDRSAAAVQALGATALRGDLSRLDVLASAAGDADAVVHLALFDTDKLAAGDQAGAGAAGAAAVAAMGDALAGSGRPLLSVAAVGALGSLGRPAAEADAGDPRGPSASEAVVLGLSERGVASAVVRLPVITHSRPARPGLLGALIGAARANGAVPLVGDGSNRWPATHSSDVGSLFPLVLREAASGAAGVRWHAIGEQGVPMRDIVDAVSAGLDLPVREVSPEDLGRQLGFVAGLAQQDLPASSEVTRERLGWQPSGASLLDDLAASDFYRPRDAAH